MKLSLINNQIIKINNQLIIYELLLMLILLICPMKSLNNYLNQRPEYHQYSTGYDPSMTQSTEHLVVNTNRGRVKGLELVAATGKKLVGYLGIPYAKPPIGKYRFRHPKPIDAWKGVLNATQLPNSCYQINDTFFGSEFQGSNMWNANTPLSEDCLKLNIWVPQPRPINSAVLVWIYGGGFYYGSTTLDVYDPKILVTETNLIVVSMQYRVASLGFLYYENAKNDVPGNAGLFDQIMSLQWIKENIKSFGGDPDNITLFGESSGAVSISFHLISPLSRNLFNRAILQSGGPTAPWGLTPTKEINKRGLELAQAVGCPFDEKYIYDVIECMRKVDPFKLVSSEPGNFGVVEFPFTPIVDGTLLDESPEDSLKNKNFKKTQILLGSNTEEGNFFIIYHLTDLFKRTEDVYLTREDFIRSVKDLNPYVSQLGLDAIIFEYTDWLNPEDTIKNRDAIDKMVGDFHFTCHVNELAYRYAVNGNDVYMYYYKHRSSVNPWPKWMGVLHADEIMFVFGEPLNPSLGYNYNEVELSRRIMRYWANFAKFGNPTPEFEQKYYSHQSYWPLFTAHGREYLTLALNSTEIGRGPRAKQCAFWQQYLPKLVNNTGHQFVNYRCLNNGQKPNVNHSLITLITLILSLLFIR